jgi:hypothetical protein
MKTKLRVIVSAIGVFVLMSSSVMAQSITSIRAIPAAGNNIFQNLGHGLQIATVCHDGGNVEIVFQNIGNGFATLNWLYSDGGATVAASGLILQGGVGQKGFPFLGKRIEGQFIFANSVGDTTVNLHTFDGTAWCETQGTAQFAPNT